MLNCPCGSQKDYIGCCEPYLSGKQHPLSPEALMRSRYTAYTLANIDYIKNTMRGKALLGFQAHEALRWAKRVIWIKLTVIRVEQFDSTKGYVEFEATYIDNAHLTSMHEKSEFIYEAGQWYYMEGLHLPSKQSKLIIARNTLCPCGSQRKFKNCHAYLKRL